MNSRLRSLLSLALLLCLAPAAIGAFSTWRDEAGSTFEGEPVGLFGATALFRTENNGGRRLPLRALAPADAIRFARETTARPDPAATLAASRSRIAADLRDAALVLRDGKLVPADLAARAEPEILVVLFGSHNDGESWLAARNFAPTYRRLRAAYPTRFDAVFLGLRHDETQHRRIAAGVWMPWLVADLAQQKNMSFLARFAPANGSRLLALSRDGVPLLSSGAATLHEVRQFIDDLVALLHESEPENPAGWIDQLGYLKLVRPALEPAGALPPLLIGSPLRTDQLRRKGVTSVTARIEVGPDGRATAATLVPDCGVPEKLRPALADGLRRGAVFSPALSAGSPVAGSFDYRLDLPPRESCSAEDLAWLRGEAQLKIPLTRWLVLRPIPVPEQSFSTITKVTDDGINVLSDFEVSDERVGPTRQKNCFNSDWFENDGAASVAPEFGAAQVVDGNEYRWDLVNAHAGFVELRGPVGDFDYSIGYAWTEFSVSQDADAWLGIGSDDGLKIWLNGELVHSRWIRRISCIDDEIVRLRLKEGKNRLLIKVQNATGDWNFVARLRAR